jgi:hypothetical protein
LEAPWRVPRRYQHIAPPAENLPQG